VETQYLREFSVLVASSRDTAYWIVKQSEEKKNCVCV
jgi:hypothetical protein